MRPGGRVAQDFTDRAMVRSGGVAGEFSRVRVISLLVKSMELLAAFVNILVVLAHLVTMTVAVCLLKLRQDASASGLRGEKA